SKQSVSRRNHIQRCDYWHYLGRESSVLECKHDPAVEGSFLFEKGRADIKHLHGDNSVFSAEEFKDECAEKNQTQSFSGVGAQH
ncbi:hypothetical protein ACHAWF_000492, partial [Thalassiosira exigua]